MKYRYSKFTGDDLDELDLEELLSKLSDMLLGSGFENPYGMAYDDDDEPGHSRQSLHDAILEAILSGGILFAIAFGRPHERDRPFRRSIGGTAGLLRRPGLQ
jgi:hypothetical protein